MTDLDNDVNDSTFDGFATFIDDDNVPGFESLNKSTFFDQVMNASKLFEQDIPISKLDESLAKLNESFSYKTVMKYNNRDIHSVMDELCFSLEEEDEEDDSDGFEEELLYVYLQKKIEQKKQQEAKSGKAAGDGESVSTATASLTSQESDARPAEEGIKNNEEKTQNAIMPTDDDNTENEGKNEQDKEARRDGEHSSITPKNRRSVRKAGSKGKLAQRSPHHQKKLKDRSERSSTSRRRRATEGNMPSVVKDKGEMKDGTERSSIRRAHSRKASGEAACSPQTPRRSTMKSARSTSPETVWSKPNSKRGARRSSLGHDILKRNFQILDKQQMGLEKLNATNQQKNVGSEQRKRHDAWKNRKSLTFSGPSSTIQQKRKTALELANQVSSFQSAAANAAVAKVVIPTIPKVTAPAKLSVNADAALSRISRVGLKAKESVKNSYQDDDTETVASKDDSCVSSIRRSSVTSTTPHRRARRRVSCV